MNCRERIVQSCGHVRPEGTERILLCEGLLGVKLNELFTLRDNVRELPTKQVHKGAEWEQYGLEYGTHLV